MPVYSQGEDYEEDVEVPVPRANPRRSESAPEPATSPPEDEEAPEQTPSKKKFQFNAKLAACIAALIALLIIIVMITGWINSNADKKAKEEQRQEALRIAAEQESYYAEHPEERPTVMDPANPATGESQSVSPAPQSGSYSLQELEILRKWGYTAAEIEVAQREGITPQGLVKQAKKDREAAQKEALMEVFDTASPEYQRLYNLTWLSGDSIDLSGLDPKAVYNTLVHTENVDFEKCGAQGTQLFIKLYLDNGTHAFMTLSPARYITLPDAGNIVVSISEVEMGDIKVIVDIHEVTVK